MSTQSDGGTNVEDQLSMDQMTGSVSGAGSLQNSNDSQFTASNPMKGSRLIKGSAKNANEKETKVSSLSSVSMIQRRATTIRNPAILKSSISTGIRG